MATNPQWSEIHPGGPMSEEEYLRLEASALDARYEYIDGVARMMSGGSQEHDMIAFNTRVELHQQFLSRPCAVSGENRKVLVGTKKSGKRHYSIPM